MTSLFQPDVHLTTTHPPEPILRTFISTIHLDENTYNNIHAGLNYFRRIYWRLLNDRESIIDTDQDNGEHNFGVIHPAYAAFHNINTTLSMSVPYYTNKPSLKIHQRYMPSLTSLLLMI